MVVDTVVTADAVLAVPVKLVAVTDAHDIEPPVFVSANVDGLYVSALAMVLRNVAADPDAVFVNSSR